MAPSVCLLGVCLFPTVPAYSTDHQPSSIELRHGYGHGGNADRNRLSSSGFLGQSLASSSVSTSRPVSQGLFPSNLRKGVRVSHHGNSGTDGESNGKGVARSSEVLRVERDAELLATEHSLDAAPSSPGEEEQLQEQLLREDDLHPEGRDTLHHLSAISSSTGLGGVDRIIDLADATTYQFREDGAELEVRVPLPSVEDAGRQLTARYVAVDCQATSLTVGVETVHGVQILLNGSSLYGSIKPSQTVWYVDETEVVLSLMKADDELSWPDLIEGWQSLARGVSTLLKGTSVCVVGESTEINWVVAQDIAAGLEYVPLQTQQLIEHVAKASVEEIVAQDGEESIGEIEEAILKNLSQHVRCVVATLGGGNGAAAQYGRWGGLHSGFSVWLSQSQAHDEESAREEVVRAKAGSLAYPKADVVVALSGWDSTAVRPTAEGSLRALKYLLMAEKDLPGKKSLYVRLGCRGDWPEIMPPGWDPKRPEDEIKRAEELAV